MENCRIIKASKNKLDFWMIIHNWSKTSTFKTKTTKIIYCSLYMLLISNQSRLEMFMVKRFSSKTTQTNLLII